MARAQLGDEQDYRQLLNEIGSAVTKYLSARIGGTDYIEDCVQEVLLAVHQSRHTYDPQRSFRAWLFAIARYKAIDCMRRNRHRAREESLDTNTHEVENSGDNMESSLAGGHMLRALSQSHREAILLTKIHGLSSMEAASRLAISESALKVRVHRGVRRLRQLLEAESL